MEEDVRNELLSSFDAQPADLESYRQIVRALVSDLPQLDELEAEIMRWDAEGREPSQFDRLRQLAWDFEEVGNDALRKRLFAGLITNADETDGYAADFLIDAALRAGVPETAVYRVMAFR